ncbi:MAG: sulfatase-like hydrolase/transferase [Anaerolineae bacterium]
MRRFNLLLNKVQTQKTIYYTIIYCFIQMIVAEVLFFGNQTQYWVDAFFSDVVFFTTNGLTPERSIAGGYLSLLSVPIAAVIAWLTLTSTRRYKIFYFCAFTLGSLTQLAYWTTVDHLFNVQDFFTGITSPSVLWIESVKLFFAPFALISIGIYGFFLIFIRPPMPKKHGAFGLIALLVVGMGGASYLLEELNYATFPVQAFYRTFVQAGLTQQQNSLAERDAIPAIDVATPTENILLIIDESVRADQLTMYGYGRETSPTLNRLQEEGELIYWPDMASAATCSVASNSVMISGLKELPDTERRIYKNPTIFHYAKAMGYKTHYFNGSSSRLWNSLTGADLRFIDNYVNRSTMLHPSLEDTDGEIAELLFEVLNSESGHFIVVNKSGVHFPYEKTYPASAAVWTDNPPNDVKEADIDLVNHYDNGLLHNTESFFDTLLADGTVLANTLIVYTSDHGESLDATRFQPHCGRDKLEARVPLMMMGRFPEGIDTAFQAHHSNIFPTLLDFMQVPDEALVADYALSLFDVTTADSIPRSYLPGDVDFFTGEPILYDDPEDSLSN